MPHHLKRIYESLRILALMPQGLTSTRYSHVSSLLQMLVKQMRFIFMMYQGKIIRVVLRRSRRLQTRERLAWLLLNEFMEVLIKSLMRSRFERHCIEGI